MKKNQIQLKILLGLLLGFTLLGLLFLIATHDWNPVSDVVWDVLRVALKKDYAMDAARARIMSELAWEWCQAVVGPELQALSDGKARLIRVIILNRKT